MRRAALIIILWAAPLSAATVRTLDGSTYEGDAWLEAPATVVVNTAHGRSLKIQMADLLQVQFRSAPSPTAPKAAEAHGPLAPWTLHDVGLRGLEGKARRNGTIFNLRGAGAGLSDTDADSFTFISQPLWGNGQVVTRVSSILATTPDARVGIMVRESLQPNARFVALLLNFEHGEAIISRTDAQARSVAQEDQPANIPSWVRLLRQGDTVLAQRSRDGTTWEEVGKISWHAPQMLLGGIVVCSHDAARACSATVDNAAVEGSAVPRAQGQGPMAVDRAVLFREGSIAAEVAIQWADQNNIHFAWWDNVSLSAPLDRVAGLMFRPLTQQMLDKIPPRTSGVLLARGDFVEGEFRRLDSGQVTLNSVLFGVCKFPAGPEAVAVVLAQPLAPTPSALVVRTYEGSRFLTDSVSVDNGALVLTDASMGALRVGLDRVAEIRAGSGRFDALDELHPSHVELSPGLDPAVAYVPDAPGASLDRVPCEHAIGEAAGAALTYDLGGKYRLFMCRVGMDDGVLPTVGVRFIVLADGKEIFRGEPRNSLDGAVPLSLNVAGIKTLSLRVENATGVALPVCGLWADAALVK